MRMMNITDIESINKVVKDVKKMSVLNMNIDSFDYQQLASVTSSLQEKEGYDMYLEVVGGENQYYILGNETTDKTMMLTSNDGRHYIVEIDGRPDYFQLAMAWKDINSMDSTSTVAFSALKDMMVSDSKWRDRRREHAKERREKEAATQAKKDSIEMAKDSIKLLD